MSSKGLLILLSIHRRYICIFQWNLYEVSIDVENFILRWSHV